MLELIISSYLSSYAFAGDTKRTPFARGGDRANRPFWLFFFLFVPFSLREFLNLLKFFTPFFLPLPEKKKGPHSRGGGAALIPLFGFENPDSRGPPPPPRGNGVLFGLGGTTPDSCSID